MERVNFSYSLNNIPIPCKNAYLKNMTFKLESFIKRIRWKAFFYEKLENTSEAITDNSGFKSVRTSPKNVHFNAFKTDLYDMVRNIEFKRVNSELKVTCQKTTNALMKTRYELFQLIKRTTHVSFLRKIITNY